MFAIVIWAVPVLAPAATTLPAFAQPDAGAVTLAAGGGGMTHGFADASGAIVTTADTVHPVLFEHEPDDIHLVSPVS